MRDWISERFDVYARGCIIFAMVAAPILFLKSALGVFAIAKLTVLWCLTVLALVLWAVWRLNGGTALPRSNLLRAGVVFVAIAAIATAFSPYRITALLGHYFIYGGLVSLEAFFLLAFLVFALYWSRPMNLHDLCRAGATAAFVATGYQLLQEVGLDWHVWRLGGQPAPWEGGTLGNPNFTGGFLGASLPFVLYLIFKAKASTTRRALMAGGALQLLALWLTGSRGGLAAGVAAVTIFAAAYYSDIPRAVKRGAAIAAAVLVMLVGVAAFNVRDDVKPGEAEPTLLGISLSPKTLVDTRVDFWKAAIGIIADHPILGTGPDTYYANYTVYRPPDDGADPELQLENNPHNIFLAHGVGTGLLGLAAYLFLFGYSGLLAVRGIRSAKEPTSKALLATFAAVAGAYVTQGLVSIDHIPLAMLGWISLAAIAVLAEPAAQAARMELEAGARGARGRGKQRRARRRLKVPATAIVLGASLLLWLGARFMVADVKTVQGLSSTSASERMSYLRQAIQLNPLEGEYHYIAATTLHRFAIRGSVQPNTRRQAFQEARLHMLQALNRRPQSVLYLTTLARVDSARGQLVDKQYFVDAGRSWRRAIARDPHNFRWHHQYSMMLGASAVADNNNRQLRLAQIEELRKSIDIYRNQPQAWTQLVDAYRAIGDQARADAAQREFFGARPSPAAAAPPASTAGDPPGAGGLAVAFVVLLGAGVAAVRRVIVEDRRRARAQKKKRHASPDHLHELMAAAGLLSIALAVPRAGPLLGVSLADGELKELLLHLVPGVAAVWLGVLHSVRPYRQAPSAGDLEAILPFATFVTSLTAIVLHLPELFDGVGAAKAGSVLFHEAPLLAIFALVWSTLSRRGGAVPAPGPQKVRESVDIA